MIIGVAMLISSTLGTQEPYANNQILFAIVSMAVAVALVLAGYRWLLEWAPIWYGAVLLLLGLVAIFGKVTRGAASWLAIGPFTLQPSELAKLALVVMLAWLAGYGWNRHWSTLKLFAMMVATAVPSLILVVIQPDMGTATVLAFGWLVCLWLSPINKRYLISMVGVVVLVAALAWLVMEPYQKARLTTFLNPSASPLGAGYNVLQSQIAVGSGQWFGQGWGRGTQSHLNFLPEHHTDFIFASLSEEFGFIGALVVVLLYGVVLWRGLNLAWHATDRTTVILASGITLTLLFQALVNMAMNVGLAPVTGIPLPLVSYGGSSLLTTICSIAVLESISLQERRRREVI